MAENQLDRELKTRDKSERKKFWTRPEMLPSPDDRDGWAHMYIRVSTHGQSDATNVSAKLREGWEPCKAKEYPELQVGGTVVDGYADSVVIGGLMLCRAPQELVDERTEHFRSVTASQMKSVDHNLMKDNDSRMPMFNERKTEVTFGKGK
tara:strand:- start:169 stop:618 length:450 start_codon:yes stop_codon:yes gene_type:complete